MTRTKKMFSSLGVAALAAGMTVSGAGAANAAVTTPHVLGNSVSVNIDQPLPGQTCFGVLAPAYAAAELGVAAIGGGGDVLAIVQALEARDDVISLAGPGAFGIHLPATIPGQPGVLFANDVPANIYALAVVCMTVNGPVESHITPQLVGNPLDAFVGSMGS